MSISSNAQDENGTHHEDISEMSIKVLFKPFRISQSLARTARWHDTDRLQQCPSDPLVSLQLACCYGPDVLEDTVEHDAHF